MKSSDVEQGFVTHELSDWWEFVDFIKDRHSNCPPYIYRGQADEGWGVLSTLDRLEIRFAITPNFATEVPSQWDRPPADRAEHLSAFKECARGKLPSIDPQWGDQNWWAIAQHHGLATPLLDWTYSPFVALFFAFEAEAVIDKHGSWVRPGRRAVFTLSSAVFPVRDCESDESCYVFSPLSHIGYRANSQGSLFLYMPRRTELVSFVRRNFQHDTGSSQTAKPRQILQKIVIPNDDRIGCLQFLNKMNINRMSLFPDLEGAALYVNALWELHFDTSLGQLGL